MRCVARRGLYIRSYALGMRWVLCILLTACGNPAPAPTAPRAAPPAPHAAPPADAAAAAEIPVDALLCKYRQCMDICCDQDEVCSHGQLGDGTFPKCLRPHR